MLCNCNHWTIAYKLFIPSNLPHVNLKKKVYSRDCAFKFIAPLSLSCMYQDIICTSLFKKKFTQFFLVAGAHPWEWLQPPPFVEVRIRCIHIVFLAIHPSTAPNTSYIAYCFPNASHITFSTQPVHNNHATRTHRHHNSK